MFFSSNKRRKRRTARGNYAFRRKPSRAAQLHRLELNRLDLNPETDATRRERMIKRAGTGARWAFGLLAFILAAALLKVVVDEAFVNNAKFRLQTINVRTEGPLSESAIITASGLKLGDHLLMISLRDVRDRIESLPEVDGTRVTVERDFPGAITITAPQRTPVAWLECPSKAIAANVAGYGCLLDAQGSVLPSTNHNASGADGLPVIRIEKLPGLKPGKKIESPAALASLSLLALLKKTPHPGKTALTSIDATREHSLAARFSDGVTATFPADGKLDYELGRLRRILTEAQKRNWDVAKVDLLVEQNVPVILRNAADPPRRSLSAAR